MEFALQHSSAGVFRQGEGVIIKSHTVQCGACVCVCTHLRGKNARDSEDVATGIEDARNCCNVVIDWLRSGHGLRKLGWTGTLRMVMGAIKLCMRLTAMPRQTDSFAKPLDSRMCLKVAENGEFQQLLWALQSAIKDYLAPRVMAESDFVPSIVDDVFVLKHAASFFPELAT